MVWQKIVHMQPPSLRSSTHMHFLLELLIAARSQSRYHAAMQRQLHLIN